MFYVMGILSLLISITYVQLTKDYANGYSNFSLLILIYASAVFIMLNNLSAIKIGERAKKIITLLSKLTFGVYIIHPFFLALVGQRLAYRGNPLVYCLSLFLVSTVLSFFSCLIVSKIPVIKNY